MPSLACNFVNYPFLVSPLIYVHLHGKEGDEYTHRKPTSYQHGTLPRTIRNKMEPSLSTAHLPTL
jgi:hypothetical protein